MKLLLVGTNRGGGGTESHLITMASALADVGHDVSAVVWPDEFIHRALAADPRIRLLPGTFRGRNDVGATRALLRVTREVRPEWLVGTFKDEYWPLAVVGRLTRVPVVLFSHLDQRMHPTMTVGVPRLVRRILAPSEYQRQRLIARGMPAAKVGVLHNPVDVERFQIDAALRATTRERLGFAPDDVVVGYVGRQERGKGVTVLADALERAMDVAPRLRMLWVGHAGDEATDLRERVTQSPHADRHVWCAWSSDVAPFFAAMDVATLPSTGRETFGRVLVEAQACGTPVLGSDSGGIPETMRDGETGFLLQPGDVDAWTDALVRLALDRDLRERMGRAGRALVECRFAAPRIAQDFTRLLESLR
jgi:glycosyltransferase involved in cell wall biosynthesis